MKNKVIIAQIFFEILGAAFLTTNMIVWLFIMEPQWVYHTGLKEETSFVSWWKTWHAVAYLFYPIMFATYIFMNTSYSKMFKIAFDEQNWATFKNSFAFAFFVFVVFNYVICLLANLDLGLDYTTVLTLYSFSISAQPFYMLWARWRGRAG